MDVNIVNELKKGFNNVKNAIDILNRTEISVSNEIAKAKLEEIKTGEKVNVLTAQGRKEADWRFSHIDSKDESAVVIKEQTPEEITKGTPQIIMKVNPQDLKNWQGKTESEVDNGKIENALTNLKDVIVAAEKSKPGDPVAKDLKDRLDKLIGESNRAKTEKLGGLEAKWLTDDIQKIAGEINKYVS